MHISVLLNECIEALNLSEDSIVVDATLGYAGHSSEILKRIKRGCLFAFDQDQKAIDASKAKLQTIAPNFTIVKSNFVNMKNELNKLGITKVNGVLFDLGVSSPQLDESERGFSYHNDANLDMRMDQNQSLTAYDVVNDYDKWELSRIFSKYGEAKFANNIAKHIVERRKEKKIETTLELVDIIKSAVPIKFRIDKHPAKQIFQAIRIEVNKELEILEKSVKDAISLLEVGGRVAIITFHSLEDRIVKNVFKEYVIEDPMIKGLPNVDSSMLPDFKLVNTKVILPTEQEQNDNTRSRSAKLRVIEKIK